MFRVLLLTACLASLACLGLHAQASEPPADNPQLKRMFDADQASRMSEQVDWERLSAEDAARRGDVRAMLGAGEIRTAKDYFHAAMVMQHGLETDDYRLAFSLAQISITLDPTNKAARWLSAATWDRLLMSKKVPQWYGTQYVPTPDETGMMLYPVDENAVTDAERAALNVPSLEEARARASKFKD